jgi:hypothetical protein
MDCHVALRAPRNDELFIFPLSRGAEMQRAYAM